MDNFQVDYETSTRPIANFNTSVQFATRQTCFKNTANQNKHGANNLLLQIPVTIINCYIASITTCRSIIPSTRDENRAP